MLIEVRGLLIDKSLEKLGIDGEENEVEVRMAFKASAIEGIREILDDEGNIIKNEVMLYTSGNESFVIRNSYDEIKQLLK